MRYIPADEDTGEKIEEDRIDCDEEGCRYWCTDNLCNDKDFGIQFIHILKYVSHLHFNLFKSEFYTLHNCENWMTNIFDQYI